MGKCSFINFYKKEFYIKISNTKWEIQDIKLNAKISSFGFKSNLDMKILEKTQGFYLMPKKSTIQIFNLENEEKYFITIFLKNGKLITHNRIFEKRGIFFNKKGEFFCFDHFDLGFENKEDFFERIFSFTLVKPLNFIGITDLETKNDFLEKSIWKKLEKTERNKLKDVMKYIFPSSK